MNCEITNRSICYQVSLKTTSKECGFYLETVPPVKEYEVTAKIDKKPIPKEKVKQEIGNNLIMWILRKKKKLKITQKRK